MNSIILYETNTSKTNLAPRYDIHDLELMVHESKHFSSFFIEPKYQDNIQTSSPTVKLHAMCAIIIF